MVKNHQDAHLLAWCQPPHQLIATSHTSDIKQLAAFMVAPANMHACSNTPGYAGQS